MNQQIYQLAKTRLSLIYNAAKDLLVRYPQVNELAFQQIDNYIFLSPLGSELGHTIDCYRTDVARIVVNELLAEDGFIFQGEQDIPDYQI